MRNLVHISDLHFGRIDYKAIAALEEAISMSRPDVLVVSGDLTQRARAHQFRRAAEFLGRFPFPKVVVPGNHDIPLFNVMARFLSPFGNYRKFISPDLEPVYEDGEVIVVGLSTPNPFVVDSGALSPEALLGAKRRLALTSREKIRVLVSHHPLDLFDDALGFSSGGKGRVGAKDLLALEPDLVLAGHWHASSTCVTANPGRRSHRSFIHVQSGTTTSTRNRGERNAFNRIEVGDGRARIIRWEWEGAGKGFVAAATSEFVLSEAGWVPAAQAPE